MTSAAAEVSPSTICAQTTAPTNIVGTLFCLIIIPIRRHTLLRPSTTSWAPRRQSVVEVQRVLRYECYGVQYCQDVSFVPHAVTWLLGAFYNYFSRGDRKKNPSIKVVELIESIPKPVLTFGGAYRKKRYGGSKKGGRGGGRVLVSGKNCIYFSGHHNDMGMVCRPSP